MLPAILTYRCQSLRDVGLTVRTLRATLKIRLGVVLPTGVEGEIP